METRLLESGLADRIRFTGVLTGTDLSSAYAAMDIFAFSSVSETQGLVLAEAMASGSPVVALDAPGAREVVRDGINGRLLASDATATEFADALAGLLDIDAEGFEAMRRAALETADEFSADTAQKRVIALYDSLRGRAGPPVKPTDELWETAKRRIAREVELFGNAAHAVTDAVMIEGVEKGRLRPRDFFSIR